jgi:hypothetical protein
MKDLVESIINKDYTKANDNLHEELKIIVARKLNEAKKMYAAKMSVGEQLKVDKNGNYDETGGKDVILSHEKQKRGLTEGDVVALDPSKRKDSNNVTKHVGEKHTVLSRAGQMSVYDNEGNHKFTIDNGNSMVAYHKHYDKHGDVESALEHMRNTTNPSYTKPETASIETMKEEAKKAAMKIMQEKVRARNVTPEKIKAAQAHSDETAKEKPVDPAALFRERKSKTKPNYNVVKLKEQVPSAEDSAKVGRMAQQAADSGQVSDIINKDADSAKVGELAKQEVKPNSPKQQPLSKPEERPGVVPRTTLSHPKFRPVR